MRSLSLSPFISGAKTFPPEPNSYGQSFTSHAFIPKASFDTFEQINHSSQVLFAGESEPSLPAETKKIIEQQRTTLYRKLTPKDRYKVLLGRVNQELPDNRRITIEQLKAYLPNPDEVFLQTAVKPVQAESINSRSNPASDAVALCLQEYMEFYKRHGSKNKKNAQYKAAVQFYRQAENLQNAPSELMKIDGESERAKGGIQGQLAKVNLPIAVSDDVSAFLQPGFLLGSIVNRQANIGTRRDDATIELSGQSSPFNLDNAQNRQSVVIDDSDSELSDVSESIVKSFTDCIEKTSINSDDVQKESSGTQTESQTPRSNRARSAAVVESSALASSTDSEDNYMPWNQKGSASKLKQPSIKKARFSADKPQITDDLKHLLDVAAKIDDVEDERVAAARRTCRLEGIAYAQSKSRDEHSQTYKKALADYGKAAAAYVKERVNQHLTAIQGHSDPKLEKKHGLRYLFRRPQKFDASGNSMGKYDEDFNDVKLSSELQEKLRVAALIEDEDDLRVLDARRQYRLSALAYAESKSNNKNSGTYAEALHEHYAKASSYVRHEAKKRFKGNDALVYKIGNRFRVLPNQLINEKGELVSKHDIDAFSVTIPSGLEKILKDTAYIDAHDDPQVIAAQHVVLEQARLFAQNKTGKTDARSRTYKDEQLKFINTCVNIVNQETQNRGLTGQTYRMKRFHIFSRFKMPQLEAAMAKSAPVSYSELQGTVETTIKNARLAEYKNVFQSSSSGVNIQSGISPKTGSRNGFNGLVVFKVPRFFQQANPSLIVKLAVSPEKLHSITRGKAEASNKNAAIGKRSRESASLHQELVLTVDDINIIRAFGEKLRGNVFKQKFLSILEEKAQFFLQGNHAIDPEYVEAFADLVAEVELDKVSRLVLKQIEEKLKNSANQGLINECQQKKRQKIY